MMIDSEPEVMVGTIKDNMEEEILEEVEEEEEVGAEVVEDLQSQNMNQQKCIMNY